MDKKKKYTVSEEDNERNKVEEPATVYANKARIALLQNEAVKEIMHIEDLDLLGQVIDYLKENTHNDTTDIPIEYIQKSVDLAIDAYGMGKTVPMDNVTKEIKERFGWK